MVRKCLMGSLIKYILFLLTISTLLFAETSVKPKLVHLSYDSIPKNIYKNQIFSITINSLVALESFSEVNTSFEGGENIEILNHDAIWNIKDSNHLFNTFYFKAIEDEAKLPDIKIIIKIGEDRSEEDILKGEKLTLNSINKNVVGFSNILANKFEVKKYKVNKYDDEYNIIVLEVETLYGNLEDFNLGNYIKQGIESISYTMPYTKAFYYAVIPNGLQNFDFVYYNLLKKKFSKISLPIVVDEDRVSTQSDLNPKNNDYTIYKALIAIAIFIVLIVLYFMRKRLIYLIFALVAIGYSIYIFIPEENVIIRDGADIYLLPTKNSTIFFVTNKEIEAKKLTTRDEYIKVILPNEKIGWIRRSDVKN